MSVTVYGASDDLVEVEGDVREEFRWPANDDETNTAYLAFSNGTVLEVYLHTTWHIDVIRGDALIAKESRHGDEVATIEDNITWVVYGSEFVTARLG